MTGEWPEHASMRPRHYTAENSRMRCRRSPTSTGFNEAAALHRGKPPFMPAFGSPLTCFNEAAALHRGKHRVPPECVFVRELLQ